MQLYHTVLNTAIAASLLVWANASHAAETRTCFGRVPPPEKAGLYADNFGGQHLLGAHFWVQNGSSIFHYCQVDNYAHRIVAQNDAGNGYYPNYYSRFEVVISNGEVWYCQQVYDALSEKEAVSRPTADASDLSKGCGVPVNNFGWTKLTPR